MRPPSFDEFMEKEKDADAFSQDNPEPFLLEVCPTPGCNCGKIHPYFEDGLLTGFTCESGCEFTAKRNAFTGDFIYFMLDTFVESRFKNPSDIRGMKFNPLGETYTDWY